MKPFVMPRYTFHAREMLAPRAPCFEGEGAQDPVEVLLFAYRPRISYSYLSRSISMVIRTSTSLPTAPIL